MDPRAFAIPQGVNTVERSEDRKLSSDATVSTTYVSQQSCPRDCPFLKNGCYAETHWVGKQTRRLGGDHSIVELAKTEASQIDNLPGRFPLRLHVVGDCPTEQSAKIVSKSAGEYIRRTGKAVWTYTHAKVKRSAWGIVSVLRSCHSMQQVKEAHKSGYAASLVRQEFENGDKAWKEEGFTLIPCPNQTKGLKCDKCQLCWKDRKLHASKSVIVFKVHGLVGLLRKAQLTER